MPRLSTVQAWLRTHRHLALVAEVTAVITAGGLIAVGMYGSSPAVFAGIGVFAAAAIMGMIYDLVRQAPPPKKAGQLVSPQDMTAATSLPGHVVDDPDLAAALIGWSQSGDDVAGSRPYRSGRLTLILAVHGPVHDVIVPDTDYEITVPPGAYLIWEHDGNQCTVHTATPAIAVEFFEALPTGHHGG